MEVCKFCKEKEADKTGSHIFTSSLISNCINEPGKKGRDRELMFGISQNGLIDSYVGPQVLPDKILEIKGRQMSDDDIASNSNDLVYNFVFCTSCEKLFGVIESKFSNEINKIRQSIIQSFKEDELARVYFLIQVLRASVVKYNDWTLSDKFEEELRIVLLDCCRKIENNIKIKPNNLIFKIPLLITFLETKKDPSSNWIIIPNFKNPTVIFLCDFVIQLFENTTESVTKKIEIYNLNDKRNPEDFIKNDGLELYHLSNCDRECLNDNLIRLELIPEFVNSYKEKFLLLSSETGILPTTNRINHFIYLLMAQGPRLLSINKENFISSFNRAIEEVF